MNSRPAMVVGTLSMARKRASLQDRIVALEAEIDALAAQPVSLMSKRVLVGKRVGLKLLIKQRTLKPGEPGYLGVKEGE